MIIRNITIFILFCAGCFVQTSCKNDAKNEDKNTKIITERIQYDVLIKSPSSDLEWYNQNLEGIKREDFIKTIINAALEGKVKTYDYFNTLLSTEDLKKTISKTDTVTIFNIDDPAISHDTVIKTELNLQHITKLRFLEEWKMNTENYNFSKKVLGLMLMKENYGDSLELRGYTPMFWIYFDSKYPDALKLK